MWDAIGTLLLNVCAPFKLRQLVRSLSLRHKKSRLTRICRGIYGRKFPPSLIPVDDLTCVRKILNFMLTVTPAP